MCAESPARKRWMPDDVGPIVQQHDSRRGATVKRAGRTTRRAGAPRLVEDEASGLARLEDRLERLLGDGTDVQLASDERTLIAFERQGERVLVRLHPLFLGADTRTVARLAAFIEAPDGPASAWLDGYLAQRPHLLARSPRGAPASTTAASVIRCHDLRRQLDETREEYQRLLGEELTGGSIAWSTPTTARLPRKSIKLGSYAADTELIRIHPALDQPFVPTFFVRWIIFHELLHHRLREDLRARIGPPHPPHFRALERRYPMHDLAAAWERSHLDRLLAWSADGAD